MYKIYQIMPGDTLENIANNFGISIEEIRKINNLPLNYAFQVGEQIVIPNRKTEPFFYYTVLKGDNMYEIAKKYNVDLNTLLQINGLNNGDYIYSGEKIMVPSANVKTYVVVENDSLNSVISKLNTNVNDLIKDNELIYLLPNQLLIVKN
ncbi:MAG: LysM peptidoglycan-binding domain-containing protein [Bacilli bacterium]